MYNLLETNSKIENLKVFRDRKWLGQINYKNGLFNYTRKVNNSKESINDCPKTDEVNVFRTQNISTIPYYIISYL